MTRSIDNGVDGAIVAFAVFTVAYHLALLIDLTISTTVLVWVVATVAVFGGARLIAARSRQRALDGAFDVDVEPYPVFAAVSIVVGVIAALVVGTTVLDDARWWLFDIAAVVALVHGGAAVLRGRRTPSDAHARAVLAPAVALGLAATVALGALLVVRPDADDVLTVNRSVWIEQRGTVFPERDTLFSNERFSYTRPENPSPSIEPFIGVIARLTPMSAPTVAYLVIAPLVSFLAVLALWRLLRTLRATLPWLALFVAVVFLAFDGTLHTSFGNFSFGRAWQGKVIFAFLVVPLLWRHALAWSRDGDRRALGMLIATNVAAVGFSTTALFIAPPITALGVLAGVRRERIVACVGGMLGALAYPLAGAVFALAAERQPTSIALAAGAFVAQAGGTAPVDLTKGLDSWDPWYVVIGTGSTSVVAALAALCGWFGTRERAARLALVLAPLALFGLFVAPPVLHALQDASSEGEAVLWRVVWVVPVPAMVGVLATGALARFGTRVSVVAALAVASVCIVAGTPVWSQANGARVSWHPEWDVDNDAKTAASRLLGMTERGDVVASPSDVGGAIAIRSVDVRAVNPRDKYMSGRHSRHRAFHRPQRELVTRGMTVGFTPPELPSFVASLDVLSVDAACTKPGLETGVVGLGLVQAGFTDVGHDDICHYWRHANP